MIRKNLRRAAKKAALRLLNMEEQAEARQEQEKHMHSGTYDPDLIPRVVDGSGDTPGPNHKTLIGRTWVSAQIAGGVSPCVVDIRLPEEWSAGHLPGALLLSGPHLLSDPSVLGADMVQKVTIYDATGGESSEEVAEGLRGAGFTNARTLQGGWAEWVEHGEPVEVPTPLPEAAYQLGDPIELSDGRRGRILSVQLVEEQPCYSALLDDEGGVLTDISEDQLTH